MASLVSTDTAWFSSVMPPQISIIIASALIFLYSLYQYLLPKPIPGIPYNHAATRSLLGDIPACFRDPKLGPFDWMLSQNRHHQSPICQVFMRLLGRPYVVLADYREAQDIMMRRKEWDRSDWYTELFRGQLPYHHITLKTGPAWKAHRRLLQDLMTPAFLNGVAAPNIYDTAVGLVRLWEVKAKIAAGSPINANDDVFFAALDAVLDFSFGRNFGPRAVPPQMEQVLKANKEQRKGAGDEKVVDFETAPIHEALRATMYAGEAIGHAANFPWPWLMWWWKSILPKEKQIRRAQESLVKEQVLQAVDRMKAEKNADDDGWVKSAVDHIMDREQRLAEKESREPKYWCLIIRDEARIPLTQECHHLLRLMSIQILGFVVAGHDTTSTTLLWALKLLTDNQEVQTSLRSSLRSSYSAALAENRMPSADEIRKIAIPYVDATVEEVLRLAGTVPGATRQCTEDTTILGHFVPKGTTVLMFTQGPDMTEPGFVVDEEKRSPSSQRAARDHGIRHWNDEDVRLFRPERWLVKDEKTGDTVYDSTAGPVMPFGMGIRQCYGRRLAYVELRILITLVVWNFELLKCPDHLSGYDAMDEVSHKPRQCFVRLKRSNI